MLKAHLRDCLATLGRLWRDKINTLLIAAVIGITLALPAGLHVLVQNLSAVSYSWEGSLQASLFLKDSVNETRGRQLAQELGRRASQVQYISREQSLAEFRALSGFGEALDLLADNPLPAVIVITPKAQQTPQQVDQWLEELGRLPEVELAKMDQKWLQRLYAILDIVQRSVLMIAALLGLAVIVTVGNTIRLDIENRRDEIVVMKLIGAPDGFIRRPFLYTGFWYGLAGGVIAWIFVRGALLAISLPARRLAGLYESSFTLTGLSFSASLLVLGGGLLLGVAGSAWTVSRHLSRIEPT
ncbi:MAG: permease-like cell division protein FtsX [Pseudomonadota bacterium]